MSETVAVSLGSDIVYVYGTVNGEAVPWNLSAGGVWRTVVPRAQNGVYEIVLTAWDAANNTATYSFTLRYGLSLITDRTQNDVNRAVMLCDRIARNAATESERAEWFAGLKGVYNASDLNRVESAVRFLADLLREYGCTAAVVFRGEDWTVYDTEGADDLGRYLGNVRALVESFAVLPETPELPESMENLTYQGANNIERVLHDVYYLIQNMSKETRYSGEDYAGE